MAAQHKATQRKTLRSALKHKVAADTILDSMSSLTTNIAAARAKIAADTNLTWDTDYAATLSVKAIDMDLPSIGQHKRTMRQVLISSMSHRRLANEIADTIEEAQISLNALLVKMDAGAGTLDPTDANWDALAIINLVNPDAVGTQAQHKVSLRKSIRSAISHKALGDFIIDGLASIETEINAMIADIKLKN